MILRLLIFYVVLTIFSSSCFRKKVPPDINCGDTQVCIGNKLNEKVYYGWNGNSYTDSLMPGDVGCYTGGPVHIQYSKKSGVALREETYTLLFVSSKGGTYIKVNKCYTRGNIEIFNGSLGIYEEE